MMPPQVRRRVSLCTSYQTLRLYVFCFLAHLMHCYKIYSEVSEKLKRYCNFEAAPEHSE
jgi:hypothetical protein